MDKETIETACIVSSKFQVPISMVKHLTQDKETQSEVLQWCPTLCDPVDCSLTASCIHGVSQAQD